MFELRQLITVNEFMSLYSIGRTSFYREVNAGRLKLRKFGSASRVALSDAENWAAQLPVVVGKGELPTADKGMA